MRVSFGTRIFDASKKKIDEGKPIMKTVWRK